MKHAILFVLLTWPLTPTMEMVERSVEARMRNDAAAFENLMVVGIVKSLEMALCRDRLRRCCCRLRRSQSLRFLFYEKRDTLVFLFL